MIIMGFPQFYQQGEGLLNNIGELVTVHGRKPLIVADAFVRTTYGEALADSLKSADIEPVFFPFAGECSPGAIGSAVKHARDTGCDFVIGFGGGKAIDTAKAVKIEIGFPVVVVPTIASNDSPTSRLAITYEDDGRFIGPRFMTANPEAILVDTGIIVQAPVRFFVAGIADALVTKFEAEQCAASGRDNFFSGRPTEAAICLAGHCYDVVRKFGVQAVTDVQQKTVTEAVEKVVEANTLLSGLGFEGCGVAAAHAIGLALGDLESLRGILHGEEVAIGLIAQLVMEGRDTAFVHDILDFYTAIGLPASLVEAGAENIGESELRPLAEFIARPQSRIHNMAMPVSADLVVSSIMRASEIVAEYRVAKF
ncbi:glycerol dehydrogenase [uncultured Hoeflea sp.]|uniref:glycerol dehydrogenase n=1 Tax=uncultured Hoeflea sp. TaxID=538666 RepID=UPI0030DC259D